VQYWFARVPLYALVFFLRFLVIFTTPPASSLPFPFKKLLFYQKSRQLIVFSMRSVSPRRTTEGFGILRNRERNRRVPTLRRQGLE
jgi:hypothetical protein